MLMRYLGLGVGHLNPADFPHEANLILPEVDHRGIDTISGEIISDDDNPNTRESEDEGREQESEDDEGSENDSDTSEGYEY